jgi:hypothetical protein
MNRIPSEMIRTFDLDHEQLLVLEDRAGARVRVLSGGLWLTEEGQPDDRFARAGDELRLCKRGRAVVGAIGRSRIELVEPVQRGVARLLERIARMLVGRSVSRVRIAASAVSLVLALGIPELLARGFQHSGIDSPALSRAMPAMQRTA